MKFDEVIKEALRQHRDRQKTSRPIFFSLAYKSMLRLSGRQCTQKCHLKNIVKINSMNFSHTSSRVIWRHKKKAEDSLNYDNCHFYAVMFYERFPARYCAIKQQKKRWNSKFIIWLSIIIIFSEAQETE